MDLSLLLIDDDEVEYIHTKKNLENGNKLFWAKCGDEAISILNKLKPNLILLDMRLQKENGFDLIPEIKKIYKDIPILMITESPYSGMSREAAVKGAIGVKTKGSIGNKYINNLFRIIGKYKELRAR